jgi:hypothetical protein
LKKKEPVNLYQKILQRRSSSDQLRNPAIFHPRYKLAKSRQGFMYQGQKLFNVLPDSIISSQNILTFNRKVKGWTKLNIPALPP